MLFGLSELHHVVSRSISPENITGEKGKGGMSTDGAAREAARDLGIGWKVSPYFVMKPFETITLAEVHAMGMIRHIWCVDSGPGLRNLILRIYWDDSPFPSVEVPLGDFFACADYRQYSPLSSLAVCVNPRRAFNCYWEMPFRSAFRITLENLHSENVLIFYQIDYEERQLPVECAYFHAQFRRVNPLPYKDVYTILDNVYGRGKYIGTYLFWGSNNSNWWGEGEIKFYLDGDREFPTICGTGTEDYFCGSYCFYNTREKGYEEYCTPYAGLSKVCRTDGFYKSQQRFSMYRWHLTDPIYFDENIRVTIQALGWRSENRYLPLQDDISSVAYWYQDTICDTFPTLPDRDYLEII